MPFRDRVDAGQHLANALTDYKRQHPVVLALPRGGVSVAAEIAAALGAPLDLILVVRSAFRFSRNWRWARWWMAASRLS